MLLARAYVENGQPERGILVLESAIQNSRDSYGSDAEFVFSAVVADSFLKAGRSKQAVSLANKYLEKMKDFKAEGFAGKAELQRIKAEAQIVCLSNEESGVYDLQSIEKDIKEALEYSKSCGAVSIQIRCCNTLAMLAQVSNNSALLEEARTQIREALPQVKLGDKEWKMTTDINKAKELLK